MENLRLSKTLNQFGNKISIIFIFFLFLSFTSCSKDQDIITPVIEPSVIKASSVIDSMGTGFNLGNTFDLASHSTIPETIYKIIDLYYNAGMRHIRIPVTWMEGQAACGRAPIQRLTLLLKQNKYITKKNAM